MNDSFRSSAETKLTGEIFYRMMIRAQEHLKYNIEEINSLNVYPVPDGDTGTNMKATLDVAIERISGSHGPLNQVVSEVSVGSLMGARGNSGVILSQLLRGIASSLEEVEEAEPVQFAAALRAGVRAAYSAVMRPVEGTILTVARKAADAAEESADDDATLTEVIRSALDAAEETVRQTPQMLDALREAGVVDAGGKGLAYILQGALAALKEEVTPSQVVSGMPVQSEDERIDRSKDLRYPFDIVILLKCEDADTHEMGRAVETLGDSLIVIDEGAFVKIHIHSDVPADILSKIVQFGELIEVNIENMQFQFTGSDLNEDRQSVAIIPMTSGPGLKEVFLELGAVEVVEGGPTMNPSTESILTAAKNHINSDVVVLMPNNPNLFMACEQVQKLSDRPVAVLPTDNIPQGYAAMIRASEIMDSVPTVDVVEEMSKATEEVRALEVTYAVDNREFSGVSLSKGDIIGFADGKLAEVGDCPVEVLTSLLCEYADANDEVTIFVGSFEQNESLCKEELRKTIANECDGLHCDVIFGGQDHYHFIVALR